LLQTAGLVARQQFQVNDPEIPAGLIASTNPVAESIVPPGTVISLLISLGPAAPGAVPVVTGLAQVDAEEVIVDAGFTLAALRFANSDTVPAGSAITTTPGPGATPAAGSAVAITLSNGPDGLVVALGFDEANGTVANNATTFGRAGALRQASMVREAGKFGRAVRFDGVDDWVTITDGAANTPLDITRMTLEAWVMPDAGALSGWDTVILKERGTDQMSFALYSHDGAPLLDGFPGPAGYARTTNITQNTPVRNGVDLAAGVWTHLALTYDGQFMRLYVNGELAAQQAKTGNLAVGNQPLRIGGNGAFAGGEYFRGLIDEVRVYNKARTQQQIQEDMNRAITPQQ
jgi:hypothetical protein